MLEEVTSDTLTEVGAADGTGSTYSHNIIRASVDALSRDGTDMRGDAQNPKSFQAPRM